eukprot:CAMPEP_0116059178 /NCGR_PEP_ID=MMETSP0322-20121206/5642_1 /TAXON_ID=163516 /ORGANISM="Leptocylindrus danicus var. apora, Strain B651" /LENGTH=643 /DNA_ID=CAMNT_0003543511 /DNA_START=101 /DNA_END=2032 /DNA_ORIENTATION=-
MASSSDAQPDDLHPFGGFSSTSPVSTKKLDAERQLASSCIREHFGVCVQAVADCLFTLANGSKASFDRLLTIAKDVCKREFHNERQQLVRRVPFLNTDKRTTNSATYRYGLDETLGSASEGYVVEADLVRAALLVLIQHNIVTVHCTELSRKKRKMNVKSSKGVNERGVEYAYHYSICKRRACYLLRYSQYVEHGKRSYGPNAVYILEAILLNGRLTTNDVVLYAAKVYENENSEVKDDVKVEEGVDVDASVESDKYKEVKRDIFKVLTKMIEGGHVEQLKSLEASAVRVDDDDEEEELTFETGTTQSPNTVTRIQDESMDNLSRSDLDSSYSDLLSTKELKELFPVGAVWRVNFSMFHASMRALFLGRLTNECHGKKVQYAGNLLIAALKRIAFKANSSNEYSDDQNLFHPLEVSKYLAPTVLEAYKQGPGGLKASLSNAFVRLSNIKWPSCINEVESAAGHHEGGKFEVNVPSLVNYLQRRLMHQLVKDQFGELSARIISVLQSRGQLESEKIGEFALLPCKEAREHLNRLYLSGYVSMENYQVAGKSYNPNNALYTWAICQRKMKQVSSDNIMLALLNIRLRKQHEMEIGKAWVERQESGLEENESEEDTKKYHEFCRGLERLDNAIIQLDESLLIMRDF